MYKRGGCIPPKESTVNGFNDEDDGVEIHATRGNNNKSVTPPPLGNFPCFNILSAEVMNNSEQRDAYKTGTIKSLTIAALPTCAVRRSAFC